MISQGLVEPLQIRAAAHQAKSPHDRLRIQVDDVTKGAFHFGGQPSKLATERGEDGQRAKLTLDEARNAALLPACVREPDLSESDKKVT